MFRTRDYAVMLSLIGFLVVAIVFTARGSLPFGLAGSQGAAIFTAGESATAYSASVAADGGPSREERVAELRKKIAGRDSFFAAAESTPETPEVVPTVPEVTDDESVKENRCGGYVVYSGSWSPAGLKIEEVEGARLVYRSVATPGEDASSTVPVVPQREIVAQLPVRSAPLSSQSCITMDVIGIATDGSLIRNNEISMYKVFGGETLIGYALDGFPLYGSSNEKTDICGGVMKGGQYRYELSDDREVILNCYAGSPISI